MRSADDADLTARARIRDAAITVFVRDGFGATVRAVAATADVSPGLVIHHFGSKAGLRAECDAHVLAHGRERADSLLGDRARMGDAIGAALARLADEGPMLGYLTRVLAEGGEVARSFLDRLVADTERSMRVAVAAGTVRPSVDEAARARHIVAMSLGTLSMDLVMNPPDDPTDGAAIVAAYADRMLVPATEYATHGLFTDTAALDAVLTARATEEQA
ncbi:TetR family transcriptional regulator [uncultured Williamsia sp.]|uniref:TetR/AcrR family transcriptional regulator n=1 Tax=uncultured Williamsia sp. TaxID=259311 RepID=UPI0026347F15|nr:TetR family transcriptional regulator [uncultured Williamsia sp.]